MELQWRRLSPRKAQKCSCKVNVTLRSTTPVVGCEINPFVSPPIWKGTVPHVLDLDSVTLIFNWYKEAKIRNDGAAKIDGGVKDWIFVTCSRNYVPKEDDLGLILKLECVVVDLWTNATLSEPVETITDPVIEFPVAQPRSMVPTPRPHETSSLCSTSLNDFTFTILSYNILSEIYTRPEYCNCPPWALVWEYRRRNLLREIIKYNADIICLQEVQSDHFENFLKPELTDKGYMAIYKRREKGLYTGKQYVADGCATFYRRHLFKEVEMRGVEFNENTSPVVEALQPDLRSEASKHLTKDNVALVVILETSEECHTKYAVRSRICVVNTHICSDPKLPHVKLFQVVTLVNELEKMLQSEIPLLICGDFNSVPQSDPYNFMVTGNLEPRESIDPYGVYKHLKLFHRFSLASAYASFGSAVAMQERQLRKFNQDTMEPVFTFSSDRFSNTLDYIFYTGQPPGHFKKKTCSCMFMTHRDVKLYLAFKPHHVIWFNYCIVSIIASKTFF